MRRLPLRVMDAVVRYLVGSRRIRSALVIIGACAMMVVVITTLHNDTVLRDAQTHKMSRIPSSRPQGGPSTSNGGALFWESQEDAFWKKPYDLFGPDELKTLKPLLENYLNAIRRLRYSLLSANRTWGPVEEGWTLLNGYDEDYFTRVSMCPQIHTVFLTADFDTISRQLPVNSFYDYAGDCVVLTDKRRAIYSNGDELLNKSCHEDIVETLKPLPLDRTILSLGLPFHLSSTSAAPTGLPPDKVILTFLNIIQNGVVTAHGEVISANVGIMTARCSHSWYKPELPSDSEQLPLYDEVLTITQQQLVWYYHNTIEDLPRIAPYLELLRDNPHIKVHVTWVGFHETMLAYLGISADRLLSGAVRGRIVYLPAGTTCGRPNIFNTQLLAAIFRQRMVTRFVNSNNKATSVTATARTYEQPLHRHNSSRPNGKTPGTSGLSGSITGSSRKDPVPQDTIVIIRRSSPDRQFRNHDAIVDMLRKEGAVHGLRVRVFSDDPLPPLHEYMQLFHRARLIVAPHGAGLANLLFAQPGTAAIEGLCEMEPRYWFCFYGIFPWLCHSSYSRVSLSFRNLATVLGQHYAGVYSAKGCLHIEPSHIQTQVRQFLDNIR